MHSYAILHFESCRIHSNLANHAQKISQNARLSSSASSNFTAISASDFNISKLTSLLHTALAELKSLRPALAEAKEWRHLMQPKIKEVVD